MAQLRKSLKTNRNKQKDSLVSKGTCCHVRLPEFNPRTRLVEGEDQLLHVVLCSPHVCFVMHACTYIQT